MPFFKGTRPESEPKPNTRKPIRRFKSLSGALNTIHHAYEKRFSKRQRHRSNSLETDTKSDVSWDNRGPENDTLEADAVNDSESEVDVKITMNGTVEKKSEVKPATKSQPLASVLKKNGKVTIESPPQTPKRNKKLNNGNSAELDAAKIKARNRSASVVWVNYLVEDDLKSPESEEDNRPGSELSTHSKRKTWFTEADVQHVSDTDEDEDEEKAQHKTKRYPRKDSMAPSLRHSSIKPPEQ